MYKLIAAATLLAYAGTPGPKTIGHHAEIQMHGNEFSGTYRIQYNPKKTLETTVTGWVRNDSIVGVGCKQFGLLRLDINFKLPLPAFTPQNPTDTLVVDLTATEQGKDTYTVEGAAYDPKNDATAQIRGEFKGTLFQGGKLTGLLSGSTDTAFVTMHYHPSGELGRKCPKPNT